MKLTKSFWARMLPVFIIVIVTVLMSVTVYTRMMEAERETCWERLEIATKSTAEKIETRLNDNLNFLDSVADSFVLTHNLKEEERVGEYLTSVMESTIFERIDVVFPDGRLLTQTGEVIQREGSLRFEELLEKGTHISPRWTDPFSGREVLYCFTPIDVDGKVPALLSGTIDCITLGELFEVSTYGEDAQIFLIDCTDGNYLIDTWHEKFDNVKNLGLRTGIDGKETVDMVAPILNRETGRIAFVSKTNGENSYQYYSPLEDYNWELCVAVQEDILFRHADELQGILMTVGIVEIMLLVVYVAWNVWVSMVVVRSEEKAKKLELDRATNEARAKFISNMSHDVRTPLNGIVGMLRIIQDHRQDENLVDECLNKIAVSPQYLSTLANDMLDINEIESDKLILEQNPIDLRELAEELKVMIAQKAQEENVTCSIRCGELKNAHVIGSEVHIKRVLVNLIGNAIKYSRDAGRNVWVTIEEQARENENGQRIYQFVVKDDGIGMSEEFQKNMYNAFEQEKVSARSDYQGYGLGLTIVNQLVKRMGGTIELESVKGAGSTFTVRLPLTVNTQDTKQNHIKLDAVDLTGVKVLLVEDNDFNLEIAQVLLEDAGVKVTAATNGKIATELFGESEVDFFDLILMDLMMPQMDGCEATKVIRSMDRPDAATIPIIAMTASAFAEEVERCKEAGMNAHIAKPLDIDKLMLQIAKYTTKG